MPFTAWKENLTVQSKNVQLERLDWIGFCIDLRPLGFGLLWKLRKVKASLTYTLRHVIRSGTRKVQFEIAFPCPILCVDVD